MLVGARMGPRSWGCARNNLEVCGTVWNNWAQIGNLRAQPAPDWAHRMPGQRIFSRSCRGIAGAFAVITRWDETMGVVAITPGRKMVVDWRV